MTVRYADQWKFHVGPHLGACQNLGPTISAGFEAWTKPFDKLRPGVQPYISCFMIPVHDWTFG